ncbi:MAG: type II toxin-antitoxin system HicB family antitoxin [Caldisericum sp.]|uniref:type II toxin-antitoxin system HicB family antitoxin n=1 Tax=Caldisericum sp. TaxID=2499687 RepID=UPI003D0DE1A2
MAGSKLLKRSTEDKARKRYLEKEVQKYMKLPYAIKLIPEEDGTYFVEVEEFPGCMSQGKTLEEALEMIKDAMEGWLESNIDRGLEIPLPDVLREYSGKFLVRVPVSLHKKLVSESRREGVSLNQYIVSLLSENYSLRNIENLLKNANKLQPAVQNQAYAPKETVTTTEWGKENDKDEQYIQ